MSDLRELLAVGSAQTMQFFYNHLRNNAPVGMGREETLYIASILAHYAQTSRFEEDTMGPAVSLCEILDNFVIPTLTENFYGAPDPEILEIAGSQTLLLVGFFRDQVRNTRRHNIRWYDQIGKGFFLRASAYSKEETKSAMLWDVSQHFPVWTYSCQRASRAMREERYLIHPN
ncbi:MAG: hypothetical protein P4L63_01240 [Candidatus Pacebacteria bacterium]|nr:hypothetical protein [Candidatus Paceibacterota bacterium]